MTDPPIANRGHKHFQVSIFIKTCMQSIFLFKAIDENLSLNLKKKKKLHQKE